MLAATLSDLLFHSRVATLSIKIAGRCGVIPLSSGQFTQSELPISSHGSPFVCGVVYLSAAGCCAPLAWTFASRQVSTSTAVHSRPRHYVTHTDRLSWARLFVCRCIRVRECVCAYYL